MTTAADVASLVALAQRVGLSANEAPAIATEGIDARIAERMADGTVSEHNVGLLGRLYVGAGRLFTSVALTKHACVLIEDAAPGTLERMVQLDTDELLQLSPHAVVRVLRHAVPSVRLAAMFAPVDGAPQLPSPAQVDMIAAFAAVDGGAHWVDTLHDPNRRSACTRVDDTVADAVRGVRTVSDALALDADAVEQRMLRAMRVRRRWRLPIAVPGNDGFSFGVYPVAALLQPACIPNVAACIDPVTGELYAFALRDIGADEELTMQQCRTFSPWAVTSASLHCFAQATERGIECCCALHPRGFRTPGGSDLDPHDVLLVHDMTAGNFTRTHHALAPYDVAIAASATANDASRFLQEWRTERPTENHVPDTGPQLERAMMMAYMHSLLVAMRASLDADTLYSHVSDIADLLEPLTHPNMALHVVLAMYDGDAAFDRGYALARLAYQSPDTRRAMEAAAAATSASGQ